MPTTKIRDAAISAAITCIATLALTFGTGLWGSKENTSDHKADVQALAAKQSADIQSVNAKLERILDAVCQKDPVRACSEGSRDGDVRIP